MEREVKIIKESGSYEFGNNYKLLFKDDKDNWLNDCNITSGSNCIIICGSNCNITCGNDCEIVSIDNCYITCGNNSEINCPSYCKITCGNNCKINCGWYCNITCGNDCIISCEWNCNIICGNNCKIDSGNYCYIKADEGSKLKSYDKLKTISNDEEFIWWYVDENYKFINTYEDKDWQRNNPDKYKELYPFVHNELDSATLF